ncbi:MAG: hypothetical protein AUG49_14640 [Catenulispora sp. 13_1_20CM_3_70_7]|nr:MAG: hypothetical protein AUG49_14640 [Catenulispora sp. 13_1_20CM_3_70_7]
MSAPGTEPTVVEVTTTRVDGVIALHDLADRLRRMAGRVRHESTDARLNESLARVGELAGQLADELLRLPADRSPETAP